VQDPVHHRRLAALAERRPPQHRERGQRPQREHVDGRARSPIVLWALRGDAMASRIFLDGLAGATALASDLLLTAV
jgi:hypothetical protein